jgi:hypothetical protein
MQEGVQFSRNIKVTSRDYKNNIDVNSQGASKIVKLKEAGQKAIQCFKGLDMFGKR